MTCERTCPRVALRPQTPRRAPYELKHLVSKLAFLKKPLPTLPNDTPAAACPALGKATGHKAPFAVILP